MKNILPSINTKNTSVITRSGLNPNKFNASVDGKETRLYTLVNRNGMEVCITNFGARIVSIMVPDRKGVLQDVVLGYDNIMQYADYQNFGSDFGAAIGRYANRINQGRITIDGKQYSYLKIILDIVCMEDLKDGNTKCMMVSN